MTLSLHTLRHATALHPLLDTEFDFRLLSPTDLPEASPWFHIEADEAFDAMAVDGAGGCFLLGRHSGHLLFVSAQGQAGVVAASLEEFLRLLLLPLPWQDLLKYAGGGQLVEMQRARQLLPALLAEDEPEWAQAREHAQATLMEQLDLAAHPQAEARLQHAVALLSQRLRVTAPDGSTLDGLFHAGTVDRLLR